MLDAVGDTVVVTERDDAAERLTVGSADRVLLTAEDRDCVTV